MSLFGRLRKFAQAKTNSRAPLQTPAVPKSRRGPTMRTRALGIMGGIVVTGGVLGGVLISGNVTESATRLVATDGANTGDCTSSPCLTPAYAYTQADPGDTIQMASGDYGDVTFAYRSGMGAADVTVRPAVGATVTLDEVDVLADRIKLLGANAFISPTLTARSVDSGITGGGGTRIFDVTVDGVHVDAQNTEGLSAMNVSTTTRFTLRNSKVGNTMSGAGEFAGTRALYTCPASQACEAHDVVLEDNLFYDVDAPTGSAAHNECILASAPQGFTATRNTFRECTHFDIFVTTTLATGQDQPSDVVLTDNLFAQAQNPAEDSPFDGFGVLFHDDVVHDGTIIRSNTFESAVSLGTTAGDGSGITIDSNIIAAGVYPSEAVSEGCPTGATITYNVMPTNCGSNTTVATRDTIFAGFIDRQLTWRNIDDFHLTDDSVALDAGNPSLEGTTDFEGMLRGGPPDAGALEFVTGTPAAPANVSLPTISGTAADGETLTGSDGTWTGNPTPTLTRQWLRCNSSGASCVDISGETATTYVLTVTDVGSTIRLRTTGTNTEGNASADSAQTAVVQESGGGSDVANVWVTTGTCDSTPTREATAVTWAAAPASAKACSFSQAAAEASCGDTVRVRVGEYGPNQSAGKSGCTGGQVVTFIGDTGATPADGVVINHSISDPDSTEWDINLGGNVTLDRIHMGGNKPGIQISTSANNTWKNSEMFEGATGALAHNCRGQVGSSNANEPLVLNSFDTGVPLSNTLIENVVFHPQHIQAYPANDCSAGDPNYHLETVRIDMNIDGLTLRNLWFKDGGDDNTSKIFITKPVDQTIVPRNLFFENLRMGTQCCNTSINGHHTVTSCVNWNFSHIVAKHEHNLEGCTTVADIEWTANAGPRQSAATCKGTYRYNVWQHAFSSTCHATDFWVEGPSFDTGNLGLDANMAPEAGSPLIGRGGASGQTSFCPGSDALGNARPFGAACDAGAIERQS